MRQVAAALELLRRAREGAEMLCARPPFGFTTRPMCEEDWRFLSGIADPGTARAFSEAAWRTRRKADAWVGALFERFSRAVPPAEPPS
jgi:hypothetical protein